MDRGLMKFVDEEPHCEKCLNFNGITLKSLTVMFKNVATRISEYGVAPTMAFFASMNVSNPDSWFSVYRPHSIKDSIPWNLASGVLTVNQSLGE